MLTSIIIEKNGLEYQISCDEMELEEDKYINAWKIVNRNPKTYKEFLKATMMSRADTANKRLGCSYQSMAFN